MARKIIHQLVDDVDGTVLEVGAGETVLFSVDGAAYEIDLSEQNASAFREALAPYITAARSARSARSGSSSTSRPAARRRRGQRDLGAVRAWAKQNGHDVAERGRVPASVIDAFDAANG